MVTQLWQVWMAKMYVTAVFFWYLHFVLLYYASCGVYRLVIYNYLCLWDSHHYRRSQIFVNFISQEPLLNPNLSWFFYVGTTYIIRYVTQAGKMRRKSHFDKPYWGLDLMYFLFLHKMFFLILKSSTLQSVIFDSIHSRSYERNIDMSV